MTAPLEYDLQVPLALPRLAIWVIGAVVVLNALATLLLAAALLLHLLGGAR